MDPRLKNSKTTRSKGWEKGIEGGTLSNAKGEGDRQQKHRSMKKGGGGAPEATEL